MLKYLIVQLADASTSFCHYPDTTSDDKLIPIEYLKEVLTWAVKRDLSLQFLYPDNVLPKEYHDLIATVAQTDIVGVGCNDSRLLDEADIIVVNDLSTTDNLPDRVARSYVYRTAFADFCQNVDAVKTLISKVDRLVVAFTDIATISKDDLNAYNDCLNNLSEYIIGEYKREHLVQVNILTDRIFLGKMNNCGAGVESIAVCPDGKFYPCPAFYGTYSGVDIEDVDSWLENCNRLYKLENAPICKICDAYQCHRCHWLNEKMTSEINTPSYEQCVISHMERNASRQLLHELKKVGNYFPDKEIREIKYLDPLTELINNQ